MHIYTAAGAGDGATPPTRGVMIALFGKSQFFFPRFPARRLDSMLIFRSHLKSYGGYFTHQGNFQ